MEALNARSLARPGTSRRAQLKRTLHARFSAGGMTTAPLAAPPAKRPRLGLPVRRAATAPSRKPTETDCCSDLSSHTTDGEPLNKASSCPPLREGLPPFEAAPLTPRLVPLPPAAALSADSKSPTPEASPAAAASPPESASSETVPAPVAAAAVADTAATAPGSSLSPAAGLGTAAFSTSLDTAMRVAAALAPPPDLAPISAPMPAMGSISFPPMLAVCHPASPPTTPNVVTPPPETPKTKARGAGRGRASSAEPRAGGYKGRFCGRLFLKEDEAKLAAECQLAGPLLGCSGAGDEVGRHTLAKIVRGIASGDVRAHCEERERVIRELEAHLAAQQLETRQATRRMALENSALRAQLGLLSEAQAAPSSTRTVAAPAGMAPRPAARACAAAAAITAASAASAAAAAAAASAPPIAAPPPCAASTAMAAAMAASAAAALAASKARVITPPATIETAAVPAFRAPPLQLPSLTLPANFGYATAWPGMSTFLGMPRASTPMDAAAAAVSPLPTFGSPAQQHHMAALLHAQQQQQQAAQYHASQQRQFHFTAQPSPRSAAPVIASLPMAAAFAASSRSAFAPVVPSGRSPRAAGTSAVGVSRPTAAVGVPPVALQSPTRV